MPAAPALRVLMTADTVGGVWTYALELAGQLSGLGVEVALATMGAPLSPAQRRAVEGLAAVRLFESGYRLEWMEEPWEDVAAAGRWLLGIARAFRPDLVHLNGYAHAALPWPAPVLVVAHSCVFSWFAAVKGAPPPPSWERYRQAVAEGLARADLVVAPTQAMLAALAPHYGPFRDGGVIPNGRDPSRFPSAAKEPFVLSAGRVWDEAKNVATLVQAARRLPWPVYIAGAARSPDGAEASKDGNTSGGATLLGLLPPDQLARWMGRAAVFALPARYEPFGLSCLEAALAGCALVVGDIPSLREVWGRTARYVSPDDPDELAAALGKLLADEEERRLAAARVRRRALRYSARRMGEAYLGLYRRLLEGPRPGEASAVEARFVRSVPSEEGS